MVGFHLTLVRGLPKGRREGMSPFSPTPKQKPDTRATILDRLNEKLRPPLPPHFNDGKMARFALRANSSLNLGGEGGGV